MVEIFSSAPYSYNFHNNYIVVIFIVNDFIVISTVDHTCIYVVVISVVDNMVIDSTCIVDQALVISICDRCVSCSIIAHIK